MSFFFALNYAYSYFHYCTFSKGDKRFWNMPSLEGVTISSIDNGFDFEGQLLTEQAGE